MCEGPCPRLRTRERMRFVMMDGFFYCSGLFSRSVFSLVLVSCERFLHPCTVLAFSFSTHLPNPPVIPYKTHRLCLRLKCRTRAQSGCMRSWGFYATKSSRVTISRAQMLGGSSSGSSRMAMNTKKAGERHNPHHLVAYYLQSNPSN